MSLGGVGGAEFERFVVGETCSRVVGRGCDVGAERCRSRLVGVAEAVGQWWREVDL